MTSPTHLAFGLLYGTSVWAFSTRALYQDPGALVAVAVTSLLPDVDSPMSFPGRLLPRLSQWLEQRYSHRLVTHSLVALLALGLVGLPLARWRPAWYGGLLLGYTSHLMADSLTKTGVPLFFPHLARGVLPGAERFRFTTGSVAERLFLGVLLLLLLLALHLSSAGGVWRVMRYLAATPAMAYRDFREAPGESWLEFEGRWRDSHEPVAGQALILEGKPESFLLRWQGRVVSYGEYGEILPERTRVRSTSQPIRLETLRVTQQTLARLLTCLPDDALVSGRLESTEAFVLTRPVLSGLHQYPCLRLEEQALECDWAPRPLLARVQPRRQAEPQRLAQLQAQVQQTRLDLDLLQLQRPPVHYLIVEAARARLQTQECELAALQDPTVHFTGTLYLRLVGEEGAP